LKLIIFFRKLVVPVALGGSGLVEQADDNENDSKGAAYVSLITI